MAFLGLPLQPRKGGKDMVAPTTHYLLVHGRNVSLTKDTNSSLDACWLGGVYTQ